MHLDCDHSSLVGFVCRALLSSIASRHSSRRERMSSSLRVAVLAAAVAGAPSVEASVIWEGQTSRGSANFEGVELQPGRFGVVSDPRGQMGNVFYCETYDGHPDYPTGKQRCEVKGTKLPDG